MKKTRKKITEYWDNLISSRLPPFATFKKIEDELKEHFSFAAWAFKRLIIPLIIFYLLVGILLETRILAPLLISLLIFLYSNFLPDIGYIVKKTRRKSNEWKWHEKYSLLFFAPIFLYYAIAGRAQPLYSTESRPFHNFKSAIAYGFFLLFVGLILWEELSKALILTSFGLLGFVIHLLVDKNFKIN
ncbi:MAG: hypothetical protein HYT71_00015 [Candidatus Aenigmarchaeota archaeon]|nr:hypothetical protein [Candidatus Aenigmarchaeota archaeon]